MPTNKQRREAARRHLERQLQRRQEREAARRRFTLIASIVGTLVVIAAVVIAVVALGSGSDTKKPAADGSKSPSPTASPTAPTSTAPAAPLPTAPCAAVPKGTVAKFRGLTITGATDLKKAPTATGKSAVNLKALACEDLVVGKGAAATTASTVTAQYVGIIYKTGKVFQSSWTSGQAAPSFGLAPGSVIDGFSQGIAGAGKVAPMRVGGRRVLIMPAVDAYGASPPSGSGIPVNASLVFIVDLKTIAS